MHKRRPVPRPSAAPELAEAPVEMSNPASAESPAVTSPDQAVVLHRLSKGPIAVNNPGELEVVVSFTLDCAALAATVHWDSEGAKCPPSHEVPLVPGGPVSYISNADPERYRYVKARIQCPPLLQCDSAWSDPRLSANQFMNWSWSIAPAKDGKGTAVVKVQFSGASTLDGVYVTLPDAFPKLDLELTVQDEGDWWAETIQKRLKQFDSIVVAMTVLIGSLVALFWKLRGRKPAEG